MSVAFTKEDGAETASETMLPDRPVSPHPNLVTEAGFEALEFQLGQAREAYETAQKIEEVNERRRQKQHPRCAMCATLRREFGRLRSLPILRQLILSPLRGP